MECKIAHVKPEAAIILDVYRLLQFVVIGICVFVHVSIGAQPHNLILITLYLETQESRNSSIKLA